MQRLIVNQRLIVGLRERALLAARAAPRRGAAAASGGSSAASSPHHPAFPVVKSGSEARARLARAAAQAAQPVTDAAGTQDQAAGSRPRLVLGIESSCDDTGVAVVSTSGRILGEALATQADIHAAWGGVVPKLAQEAHEAAIDGCVDAALAAAGVTPDQLDAVAVTIGPGLSLCLRVRRYCCLASAASSKPTVPAHRCRGSALAQAEPRRPASAAGWSAQGAPAGGKAPPAPHPGASHGGARPGCAAGRHALCSRGGSNRGAAGCTSQHLGSTHLELGRHAGG